MIPDYDYQSIVGIKLYTYGNSLVNSNFFTVASMYIFLTDFSLNKMNSSSWKKFDLCICMTVCIYILIIKNERMKNRITSRVVNF